MPDVETNLWQKYKDQGLKVVALDAYASDITNLAGVTEYVSYLGPTYPVGCEINEYTYGEIENIFDGGNPFPVDIVIDKNGVIQYIAREYDAAALEAAIVPLL